MDDEIGGEHHRFYNDECNCCNFAPYYIDPIDTYRKFRFIMI
jgi:hypothetical protein